MLDPVSVVCCGLTTIDIVQIVDRLPSPDEKIVAGAWFADVGGPAANAAATAVALGGRARVVTGVGANPVGRLARHFFETAGVELVDLAGEGDGDVAISSVLVTSGTGDRAVVSTNADHSVLDIQLSGDELDGVATLLVDGHHMDTAIQLASAAKERGVPVVFDGGSWKPRTRELLEFVDVAVVSSAFADPSGAEPLRYLADAGCESVAITRGRDPIQVHEEGRRVEVPVPSLGAGDMVDTLAAGDVLHGALALLIGYYRESLSFVELVRRASLVATESCRHRGARGWTLNPAAVAALQRVVFDG